MTNTPSPQAVNARAGNRTIAGIIGLLIITALAIVPLTLTIYQIRESDAFIIDMAGRQRMLLERYMKELLLASHGVAVSHDRTRAVLGERLHALIDGGATVVHVDSSETVVLPGAPSEEIRLKLLEQQRQLDAFTIKAEEFLRLSRSTQSDETLRDELLEANAKLLKTANDAVALMTRHSGAHIQSVIRWEIVVVLLVVAVASIQTRRFLRAEQELKISQAMAMDALRESDRVKSALLSSVSHELRTPLTAIKSMVFSLRDDGHADTGPSRTEFLKEIDDQVNYLNRLVGNLLDMSRLEAGTLKPHREWHVVEELVEGAIRRVEVLLTSRPLQVELATSLPPIYVDGLQIQQVLINLLDNAIKFSAPASPIRLSASLAADHLEVSVSNTGDGVPPGELDRIFDRFYRARSGRSSGPPGTGLGLAICKGIIEAHGGRIMARSVPGQETTFLFSLPLKPLSDSRAPVTAEAALAERPS